MALSLAAIVCKLPTKIALGSGEMSRPSFLSLVAASLGYPLVPVFLLICASCLGNGILCCGTALLGCLQVRLALRQGGSGLLDGADELLVLALGGLDGSCQGTLAVLAVAWQSNT